MIEEPQGVSIVIPAYNEEESIADVVRGVRETMKDHPHEVLVIDDGSSDLTAEKAREAGALLLSHHKNKGYGASLKSGIRQATYEIVVTFDADGQHDPNDIPRLLDALADGYDAVIGARDKKAFQYAARMPGKKLLQCVAGFLVGERPEDVNSGLRVFRKSDVTAYFPICPNAFSFSTTLTLAMLKDAFDVGTIPIQTAARVGRRSTVKIKDGLRTFMLIIRIATLFNPLKVFLPVSIMLFLTGFLYASINLFRETNIPDGSILLILSGVIIFFFGILSDQLSSIRRIK